MKNIFYSPKNTRQYDAVVEKLRIDLKEIEYAEVPTEEVEEYVKTLLTQIRRVDVAEKSVLYLMLEAPENLPIEERIMYVYTPTYLATAILSIAYQRYPEIKKIEGIRDVIKDMLSACVVRRFSGHGFDNNDAIVDAIQILVEGDVTRLIELDKDLNPEFVEIFNDRIRYVVNRIAQGLENDCFGYSPIEKAQLLDELIDRKEYCYD